MPGKLSPVVSGIPSMRFIFCTACPDAPFIKLSMALVMMALRLRLSTCTPISQKLDDSVK